MVYKSVDEVVKKQELVGKVIPLQEVIQASIAANASTTYSYEVPLAERWIIDEIVVAGNISDGITLSNVLIQPDRRPYPLNYPVNLTPLKNLVASGDNRVVFDPPIILDRAERQERVDITFTNTTGSAATLAVVIKGIKILKK